MKEWVAPPVRIKLIPFNLWGCVLLKLIMCVGGTTHWDETYCTCALYSACVCKTTLMYMYNNYLLSCVLQCYIISLSVMSLVINDAC